MRIELSDQYLIRDWHRGDIPALVRQANNPHVAATLRDRFPHPYTEADAVKWLELVGEQQVLCHFAIVAGQEAIGGIGLELGSDVYSHSAELGYWLGEPFWGRGITSAAVSSFVQQAFSTFGLIRISASVFANNPASARVLEKAGFQLEGRLRKAVVKNGEVLDELHFALVL